MANCRCLKTFSARMNSSLSSSFAKYADSFYLRPYMLIMFSCALFGSMLYGSLSYEEVQTDSGMWIPEDAQSLKDIERVEDIYKTSYKIQRVYIISKDEGLNLLTSEVFEQIIQFQEALWRDFSVEDLTFNDICFKSSDSSSNESSCETSSSPLLFFLNSDASFDRSSLSSTQSLLSKINSGKGTLDFFPLDSSLYISVEEMFGGTTPKELTTSEEGTNNIEEAQAIRWTYYLTDQLSASTEEKVFREIEAIIDQFNQSNSLINIYPYSDSLRRKERNEAVEEDLLFIYLAIVLLIMYSCFVLGQLDTYRSRLFVGLFGFIGVIFAYYESLGLGIYIGLDGNALVGSIPFLLFGIGLDDMYVLLLCFNQAPRNLDGKEKFKYMMKHAGVSITITSLTNICAFAIGGVSTIPGVRNYCLFLTLGILFDYINQITLFLGVLAYDIRRSEKEKGDCCGLVFCQPNSTFCCKGKYIFEESGELQMPLSQRIIEKVYGKTLVKKRSKVIVIVFFLLLTGLNIYGLSQFTVNYDIEWLIQDDFYIYNSIRIRDKYFDTHTETVLFYTLEANFEERETQLQIRDLEELIDSCEGCEKSWIEQGSTISWYSSFKDWIRRGQCAVDSQLILLQDDIVPSEYFYDCLQIWVSEDEGKLFSNKLAWEDSILIGAAIETSFIIPDGVEDTIQAVEDTRNIGNKGPDETFPIGDTFYWGDQFAVFAFEAILGISCCLGVVFFILLLTLADLVAAVLSLFMVVLTVIGQLSLLYFWGEHLNTISITFTIMAIGVSVDYSAHFIHSYKSLNDTDRDLKIIKTLGSIGTSIFNGFFSTFLGVFPILFSSYFPFIVLFKSWFGILLYSVTHGLILLPVLLSFIDLSHEDKEEGEKKGEKEQNKMVSDSVIDQKNEHEIEAVISK